MSFLGWVAMIGWAIVIVQNGFTVARWIQAKVKEGKAMKQGNKPLQP